MPLVPFPDWKPDASDYEANSSQTISGVIPTATGYAPLLAGVTQSQSLAAACRGAFQAYGSDGSLTTFAATSTKLYKLANSGSPPAWTDVSKGSSTYTTIGSGDNWHFAQYGNFVIAVQANTTPQWFDLRSSTNFADFSSAAGYVGSVPNAKYVSIVGRFVVLSGLASDPYSIQWSGLDAPFTWDGTNSSSSQQLPDGGVVRGIAGGEFSGLIFQDYAVRKMTYTSEAVVVFTIERISQDKGLFAPDSLMHSGEIVFYLSPFGLTRIDPGGLPVEVGKAKFNNTLMADLDQSNKQLCIGSWNPNASQVFIAYKSNANSSSYCDKLLCYDYALDKATLSSITAEYFFPVGLSGFHQPQVAGFNLSHVLVSFSGNPIEAILDTAEQGTDGTRMRIRGLRPITDANSGAVASLRYRETTQQSPTATSDVSIITRTGMCPFNVSTRYARMRVRIQASTNWTFIDGIEPDIALEGKF